MSYKRCHCCYLNALTRIRIGCTSSSEQVSQNTTENLSDPENLPEGKGEEELTSLEHYHVQGDRTWGETFVAGMSSRACSLPGLC